MDPYEFEHLVADLWEQIGFETHVRQGSRNRGIDIEATQMKGGNEFQLIQVKRYSSDSKVGSKKVREYATLYQQVNDADRVVIVTSGDFTPEAERLARDLEVTTVEPDDLFLLLDSNADLAVEYLFDTVQSHRSPLSFGSSSGKVDEQIAPSDSHTADEQTAPSSYTVEDSPFPDRLDWKQVNPNQTHFETCPECTNSTVWFAKLNGTRYLKFATCEASWRKVKKENQGLIFSKETVGLEEYEGPNEGMFKSKAEWTS